MAQTQPAPAAGAVPDPGGLRYPVNSIMPTPPSPSLAPAIQPVPATQSAPGAPAGGVQRSGISLPLNSPRTQTVGAPAQWSAPTSGSFPVAGTVSDPGMPRFAVGSQQTIGMPADTAAVGGGHPGALGGYVPGPTQPSAQWSQFNPNGNPNPGALSGGPSGPAPTYLPGQTAPNQVSPEANPNPGGL